MTGTVPARQLRQSPFALRVVERRGGRAAIVYRRRADAAGRDRFQRVAAISPLAFTAALPLLRDAVARSQPPAAEAGRAAPSNHALAAGPFYPLDDAWGPRVACFALVAAGLRDGERLMRAAGHLRAADGDEAAWWLGMLARDDNRRALRALRILTEAVE
jgi:hypothetical protein